MRRKYVVFLCALLILGSCSALFVGWTFTRNKVKANTNTKSIAQSKEVPAHVIYYAAFRHIAWLNEKAAAVERQGKDGTAYRNRYKIFAGLSDSGASLLNQVALGTIAQVKGYDEQAKNIIDAVRAKGTKLEPSQKPPSPPAELLQLQQERTAAITTGINTLRERMTATDYAKLDGLVKKEVSSKITSLAPNSPSQSRQPQLLNQLNQSGGNK